MTNKTEVLDILRKADATLSDPSKWNNTGGAAKTADGYSTASWSSDACKWCMAGAIWKNDPSRDHGSDLVRAAEVQILKTIYPNGDKNEPGLVTPIFTWNDAYGTTFEMVKKVFADTIARLEKEDV